MSETDFLKISAELIGTWGPIGAVMAILLAYHKPVLGMISRATRDPLVESLGAQNAHFDENNKIMKNMAPLLGSVDQSLKLLLREQERQTHFLREILTIETAVKDELLRGNRR